MGDEDRYELETNVDASNKRSGRGLNLIGCAGDIERKLEMTQGQLSGRGEKIDKHDARVDETRANHADKSPRPP